MRVFKPSFDSKTTDPQAVGLEHISFTVLPFFHLKQFEWGNQSLKRLKDVKGYPLR